MKPTVTVLVPTYNAGRYLAQALTSVLDQRYPHWQMIVIDDASTDQSIAQARYCFTDKRVTYLHNRRNLGQSKSLNRGLALVQTPYTLQLDSDDWFAPEALTVLVKAANAMPRETALVSGNIAMVFESEYGHITKEVVLKNRSFVDRYDFLQANCSQWPRFYRTSALRRIGGWPTDDPYEGRYMEDRRVLLRLIEEFRFDWLDRVLYFHRRHSGNQTNRLAIYNEMNEWVVRDALKRWNSPYEPVFEVDLFGRLHLKGLR